MNSKNVLNKNFNNNFDECVFVFNCTKNVITFFRKFINYNTNRVVTIQIKKINNKIHKYILLSFNEHEKKY